MHDDTLHLLLPVLAQEDTLEFTDAFRQAEVHVTDRFTLQVEAEFPAALVRFDVELRPHALDYATLYDELSEYPSGEFRKVGPLDLSFVPPPHMAIPMLAVYLDGELYGKMWFEMPSAEDVQAEKLGGVFALEFNDAGRHSVTIAVDEDDRYRLDLFMLDRVTIHLDDRGVADVAPRSGWDPETPWLFLDGHSVAELRRMRETTHRQLWDDMVATVEYWLVEHPSWRGIPMLGSLAFIALVEPEHPLTGRLIDILEARYAQDRFLDYGGKFMFFEPGEGLFQEKQRWLMGYGWNDYGLSFILLDYCCIYQWLGDRLPAHLHQWIEENLARFTGELYRFGQFQRQYAGGLPGENAHTAIPVFAVAAAAATLYRRSPAAPHWMNVAAERIRQTWTLLPKHGKADFLVWGVTFLVQGVKLLQDFAGWDGHGTPFFRNLGTALWRLHGWSGNGPGGSFSGMLMAYCAGVQQDAACQWFYQQRERTDNPLKASYLTFLWHCMEAGEEPADKDRSFLFPEISLALLQTNYEKPRFSMRVQCGSNTGANACQLESFQAVPMGSLFANGSFAVGVNGTDVIRDMSAAGYIRSFANANVVAVDGGGFFLEGMYLIGRTEPVHFSVLRQCRLGDDLCYLDGLNTRAYAPELEIRVSRRQWLFDAQHEWALVVDDIASAREHGYALHLHTEAITQEDAGVFRLTADGQQLHLVCLPGQPTDFHIVEPSFVLSYPYGVTRVKDGGLLTPDTGIGSAPPTCRRLECRAVRGNSARFITLMSPHRFTYRLQQGELFVETPLGQRTVRVERDCIIQATQIYYRPCISFYYTTYCNFWGTFERNSRPRGVV